jgi:hypothetical protein
VTFPRALLIAVIAMALIDCAIDCGVRTDGAARDSLHEAGILTPRLAR